MVVFSAQLFACFEKVAKPVAMGWKMFDSHLHDAPLSRESVVNTLRGDGPPWSIWLPEVSCLFVLRFTDIWMFETHFALLRFTTKLTP
jgi:hypothetical protein